MNDGVRKFEELIKTDVQVQEKLKKALENYTGEHTEEAIFNNVLIPAAEEYGITAAFEDYKEYVESLNNEELSKDELTQVAGGKLEGIGVGYMTCRVVGLGGGINGTSKGGSACVIIGAGWGDTVCAAEGEGGING